MQEWIVPTISVVGSVFGSFIGVRIAVAKLEVQVTHIDGMMHSHDTAIDGLMTRVGIAEGDLTRMKIDIGTHDTGMRGELHDNGTMLTQHELRLHLIDHQPVKVR